MNLEKLRRYMKSRKGAMEDFPFDPETLVFKVGGKMFSLIFLSQAPLQMNLKADPDKAVAQRAFYPSVLPGYHMNKRHWNTIILDGSIPDEEVLSMIDESYALVVGTLTRAARKSAGLSESEDQRLSGEREKATFGAGCFWGVEAAFGRVKGVVSTSVGYMGGHLENPTYEDVCTDTTGHAEVVEVIFDPETVSYRELLEAFWQIHDPTTPNRQGPDVGSQYRSVIFYHSPAQQQEAQASLEAQQQSPFLRYRPIVTAIEPAATFYRAEEYHQQYLAKR